MPASRQSSSARSRSSSSQYQPLPVSASAWRSGVLHLRLSGAEAAVGAAIARLGGECLAKDAADVLWAGLRDQRDAFFDGDEALWRLSLPSDALAVELDGAQLVEWGGAQRWLRSSAPADRVRARVAELGGHATLFRHGDRRSEVFHPLPAPLMTLHRRLKNAFDPAGIFNPGRLYEGL